MKTLKEQEIRKKMETIAEAAGIDPARLKDMKMDVDGDFDPDSFEQQLSVSCCPSLAADTGCLSTVLVVSRRSCPLPLP